MCHVNSWIPFLKFLYIFCILVFQDLNLAEMDRWSVIRHFDSRQLRGRHLNFPEKFNDLVFNFLDLNLIFVDLGSVKGCFDTIL